MIEWSSLKTNNGAGQASSAAPVVIEEPVQSCAFCRGKGEKPAGSQCSVCRGKGTVEIRPPAVKCAACRGRGEEPPRSNITCSACRGKGYVTVTPPIQKCGSCRGTGRQRSSRLACTACRGAGVATSRTAAVTPKSTIPTVSGSELETLRIYARAALTGQRIVVSDAVGLSPAYLKLLRGALIEKGLLRRTDSRQLQITDCGSEVVRMRGGTEAVEHDDGPPTTQPTKGDQTARLAPADRKADAPFTATPPSRARGLQWTVHRRI